MQHGKQPHDFHPDLTADRLSALVKIVKAKRSEAFEIHSKAARTQDLYWSTCCLAFELVMNAFEALASEVEWLKFHREQRHAYALVVGAVPFRVQRSDHAPKRLMNIETTLAKGTQGLLPFGDGRDTLANYMVRLEFAADGDAVSFCELSVRDLSGDVLYDRWIVGDESIAVANEDATPLVRAEPQVIEPAAFDVLSEDAEHADRDAV